MKIITLFFLFIFALQQAYGQIEIKSDSIETTSTLLNINKEKRSPKTAALRSLLPGLGKVYNKKYWKIPIVYAVGGALVYGIDFSSTRFKKFDNMYKQGLQNNSSAAELNQLRVIRENYRRNRDLLVILSVLAYGLNAVESAVDAHLSEYDVSDRLSIKWKPYMDPNNQLASYGVSLIITLK